MSAREVGTMEPEAAVAAAPERKTWNYPAESIASCSRLRS
jgi:hypothetical protein